MPVLDGLKVLDLSWGVAGPAAAMLLCDHGAEVTRIERPAGDPFEGWLDYRVYHRGKRSAVLDLHDPDDRARLMRLADGADVFIESYRPGVAARLGIDYATLAARNPRLIYCSITGYGSDTSMASRPGIDQLVAARTGFQWEARCWPGSAADHLAGRDLFGDASDFSEAERRWFDRQGPVFTATPAPSVATAYIATLAINAALRARLHTNRGQHIETSLLQGVVSYMGSMWQRSEHAPANLGRPTTMGPIMQTAPGVSIMSGPWALFECADGRWVNFWTSPYEWAILAGRGETLELPDPDDLAEFLARTGGRAGNLDTFLRLRLEAIPVFRKFAQAEWVALAAQANLAMQPVRAPEEVLTDPALVAEGAVVDVHDPELGPLRQPGILYRLHRTPGTVRGGAPIRGQHTSEVIAEADRTPFTSAAAAAHRASLAGPLAGVLAIDFGLAVAGPWGGELLAQLGADVIKVDPPAQDMWLSTNMAMKVNRSKRHLSLDAKRPEGLAVVHDLVRRADIVLMNMRPQAARKLGLDYESLRAVNPGLVYCRTAGFDHSRETLKGNDQTGNALGGTEWEDGGVARGGRPYWSVASGGDLGNGYLSAIAMVQALYHRERTGEGQNVDTHIQNAAMFSSARVYTTPDGRTLPRLTVDPDLLGFNERYRLYECAGSTWLCVAALVEPQWSALMAAVGATEPAQIEARFATRPADEWFAALDAAGVPCEVSSLEFAQSVLDDPELIARNWVVRRHGQPLHGWMDMFGKIVDFSDTITEIGGPPPVPGQHSREILRSIGYTDATIDELCAEKVVFEA